MFVCYYCEKDIQCVTFVVDGQHFAHSECIKNNKTLENEKELENVDTNQDIVSR